MEKQKKYDNMYQAALAKDCEYIKNQLQQGFSIDKPIVFNKTTLLHVAIQYGYRELVSFLCTYRPNMNAQDDNRFTPLGLAIRSNKTPDITKCLLQYNANPLLPGQYDTTTGKLILDYHSNEPEWLALLPVLSPQNMYQAAHAGDFEYIRNQLQQGFSVDKLILFNKKTLLHESAQCGHKNLVELLCNNYGAEINAQDDNGFTPLALAILFNKTPDIAKYLLEHNADPSIPGQYNIVAKELIVYCREDQPEWLSLLPALSSQK